MYRFVLSARWIGLGLLMTFAAAVMVGLGFWQLHRYYYRTAINNSIDAAAVAAPVPLSAVLKPPAGTEPGTVGPDAPGGAGSTRVSVTGRYDEGHEILARARTVNDTIGFEIVTPLVLDDGTALLVDRGWIPSPPDGVSAPAVPPAPSGTVTVLGRIHASESSPDQPQTYGGHVSIRRIAPASVASSLPYPVYGAYVTMDAQTPPKDPRFVAVAPDHENAGMNAGYVAQWWSFAVLTLAGYVYLVMKEARVRQSGRAPVDRVDDAPPRDDSDDADPRLYGRAPDGGYESNPRRTDRVATRRPL
jgi:cytochrome oxidase assembly protein ShyY1